jgi:hypothetical protein
MELTHERVWLPGLARLPRLETLRVAESINLGHPLPTTPPFALRSLTTTMSRVNVRAFMAWFPRG